MHKNSLESHQLNLEFGMYQTTSERILNILSELGKATMVEVADKLQIERNKISGRFGELVKQNKIEIVEKVKINGYPYSVYRIK